jgi:hypothetical protein
MSQELLQARFTFGTESELRYVAAKPTVGDSVAHHHALWHVASTEKTPLGFNVVCERPSPALRIAKSEVARRRVADSQTAQRPPLCRVSLD